MSDTDTEAAPAADTEFPSVSELGNWLLQYEILERIHVGRESAIYFAKQPALDRHVMIRVMSEPAAEAVPMLLERLRKRARLVHPRIVGVFDFGRSYAGPLYLITEHVDGVMLDSLIRDRQVSPKHAYALALQLCDTLQIIHDQQTVHGALSSRTLLVTRDWHIKVTGIGMTETADGELSWIESGGASFSGDIRALGVVLHEMFGREPPAADGRVSRDLPPAFAAVIRRCLATDAGKQFTRPDEVREALTNALRSEKQAATVKAAAAQGPAPGSGTHAARPAAAAVAAPGRPGQGAPPGPGQGQAPAPAPARAPGQALAPPPPRYAPGRPPAPVQRPRVTFAKKLDDFLWSLLSASLHIGIFAVSLGILVAFYLLKDKLVIEEVDSGKAREEERSEPVIPASQILGAVPPPPILPVTPQKPAGNPITLPAPKDPLAELDAQYAAAVQREASAALNAVGNRMNEQPFILRELQRLQSGQGVPATDEPDLPASLKQLREKYRQDRAKLGR